jgi:hypothetical protein
MAQRRSAIVTTLGILHLVGGGLGLVISLCAGFGLLIQQNAQFFGGQDEFQLALRTHLVDTLPAYRSFEIGGLLFGLVLDILLLSTGMGLLLYQSWARYGSFVYAGLSIFHKLVQFVYSGFVVYPAGRKFTEQHFAMTSAAEQAGATTGFGIGFFGTLCVSTLLIVYPVVVIILLLMPTVAESFAPQPQKRRRDREDNWEEEDER